jgi:DHA1 family multidrug resistance protein-like MFS transporter
VTPGARAEVWRTTAVAVPSSLLSQVGFYAILPLLPVLLPDVWQMTSPWMVGGALFALSASMRGSSILLSNLLRRVPARTAVGGSLGLSAAAFLTMSCSRAPFAVFLLLVLAGAGISVSALSLRVYVTDSLARADLRSTVFSATQVAANVAAAIGPLIGTFLLDLSPTALLLGVSAAYCAAAGVALALVPATSAPAAAGVRPPLTRRMFVDIVRVPQIRAAVVTAATGCFLYAQLFSAIVIQLASVTSSGPVRSSVFVLNAVLVVALQAPVTRAVNRRLRGSTPSFAFLRCGVAVFAASALVLSVAGRSFGGVLAAVVVFSVAETVFSPMLNTVFGDIRSEASTLEMFNVRQLASAVGESSGTFVGGAVLTVALAHGLGPAYWMALSITGAAVVVAVRRWPAVSADPRTQPQPLARPRDKELPDE